MYSTQRWVILTAGFIALVVSSAATIIGHEEPRRVVAASEQGGQVEIGDGIRDAIAERKSRRSRPKDDCLATAGKRKVWLSIEEARNAATIAAVGKTRDLPTRAISIALATAYQESDLHNLDYGDRDSLGLFQQRPSQGWGSPEQVMDPVYAAGKFYDTLVTISGYGKMKITDAAQAVQRSAYPKAYAKHGMKAKVLARALSGRNEASLYCSFKGRELKRQEVGERGLTPRAADVFDEVTAAFGKLPYGGFAPGGVSTGHVKGSAHYEGRAVDLFFEPHDAKSSDRDGWAVAHWLVANAERLDIETIIYDDRIWTERKSRAGWRDYKHPDGDTDNPTLRHLDHVHVDVARGGKKKN